MHDAQTLLALFLFVIAVAIYLRYFRDALTEHRKDWLAAERMAVGRSRTPTTFGCETRAEIILDVSADAGCRFAALDAVAVRILDPTGMGLAGRRFDELYGQSIGYEFRQALRLLGEHAEKVVRHGLPVSYRDSFCFTPGMDLRNYEFDLVPVQADGGIRQVRGFVRDISPLQRYADEVQKRTSLEARFTGFIATAPGFFYSLEQRADGSCSIPFASDGIRRLFSLSPQDVLQSTAELKQRIHPDDREYFFTEPSAASLVPALRATEFRVMHPERGLIWVESRAMPSSGQAGTVVWHGFMHEVTERKQAERNLQRSQASLAEAQRIGQMGSWECEIGSGKVIWSEEMCRIYEMIPALCDDRSQAALNAVHPDDLVAAETAHRAALQTQTPFRLDYRLLFPDGRIKYVREHCEVHQREDEAAHLHATVQDITALKVTELQLKDTQEKLRELAIKRELQREGERKRIAWEMHEELGQLLAAIKMRMSVMRTQIGSDVPALHGESVAVSELVDRSIRSVHELVSELRPTVLLHGPVVALEWLVAEFNKHPDIECELEIHGEEEWIYGEALATLVFRIAQEVLEDAARQEGLSRISLSWDARADGLLLTIRHNGGNEADDLFGSSSLGLFDMQERAAGFGGEICWFNTLARDTVLEIWFRELPRSPLAGAYHLGGQMVLG
jgi:signal transduction histidine kinase